MKDTGNVSVTVIKHALPLELGGRGRYPPHFFFYTCKMGIEIRATVFCWITLNPCSLNKIKPPTSLHIQTVGILSEVRGLVINQTDPNLIKISPSIPTLGLFLLLAKGNKKQKGSEV